MCVWTSVATVHPRAGGEHITTPSFFSHFIGSSPRGRGTHRRDDEVLGLCRFIPARAGNTRPRSRGWSALSVHPRAGGEHVVTESGHTRRSRFIPARAGNTWGGYPPCLRSPVHPRAGGEHETPPGHDSRGGGSSPRGRGTRNRAQRRFSPKRFIPARAGNTRARRHQRVARPVHPRAGGEHAHPAARMRYIAGSSPRGRGTLFSQLTDSKDLF